MVSGTLGASLIGSILSGKGIVRGGYGNKEKGVKQGDEMARAVYGSKMEF